MSRTQTAEEVEQVHTEVLGKELGEIFNFLHNDLRWLSWKWNELKSLYMKEENVKTLNKAAPQFFFMVQKVLLDDVILHIGPFHRSSRTNGIQEHVIASIGAQH